MSVTVRVDKNEAYDIFIGRPSKFSNPFVVDKDGTREEVIQKFEDYARNHPQLFELLAELTGNRLACWCKKCEICHGDTWIKLINEQKYSKLLLDVSE